MTGWLLSYHPHLVERRVIPCRARCCITSLSGMKTAPIFSARIRKNTFRRRRRTHRLGANPGFGYRVQKDDRIRVETMVHNPTPTSYDKAFLESKSSILMTPRLHREKFLSGVDGLSSCGNSGYDLPAAPAKNPAPSP